VTLQEIHDLVDLEMNAANAPWFNAIEKDKFINKAHMDLVEDYYRQYGATEEFAEKLATLTERPVIAFTQLLQVGTFNIDTALVVPEAINGSYFMYIIKLIMDVTDDCGIKRKATATRVEINDLENITKDPFSFPKATEPLYYVSSNAAQQTEITAYVDHLNAAAPYPIIGTANKLYYLRSPRRVSLTPLVESELPPSLHDELVERTVLLLLENVKAARQQTHQKLN
jgi:hypothetical protein